MATGDPVPTLSLLGTPPAGISFVANVDGTATISGIRLIGGGGGNCGTDPGGEGDPEGGDPCGDYAFTVIATNSQGVYAQALGMSVNTPPTITSVNTATFTAGSASSFTITGTGNTTPIFYTWDEGVLAAAGVQLIDNENGTASLIGTPNEGTYVFTLYATTGCPVDAENPDEPDTMQEFTWDGSSTTTS